MHPRAVLHRVRLEWATRRALHWLTVFAIPMTFFLCERLVAMPTILNIGASRHERDVGHKLAGNVLGMAQDLIITCILVACLVVVEAIATTGTLLLSAYYHSSWLLRWLGGTIRFVVVLGLVTLTLAFDAADSLLLRTRQMRFTTDFIATYEREKAQASDVAIDPREIRLAKVTIITTGLTALFFTVVFVAFVDLLGRRRTKATASLVELQAASCGVVATPHRLDIDVVSLEEGIGGNGDSTESPVTTPAGSVTQADDAKTYSAVPKEDKLASEPKETKLQTVVLRKVLVLAAIVLLFLALFFATRAASIAVPPLIASIALNTSLNELVRNLFNVEFQKGTGSGSLVSAAVYLEPTETYQLFEKDVLYRNTTGFNGPLAFDVQVNETNPPNVLVLVIESFRYMDSLLISNNSAATTAMQKHNLTLTPNFDRWAKRGIAFNNMWSSAPTSRSLETILFGQLNFDSITTTGTTGGRQSTKLSGMPQFFSQKGYETVFSTGATDTYDQWDQFLPSHGFETILCSPDFKVMAETIPGYNITSGDWDGPAHRGFNWGVHDDVSFELIGDILINKTKAQADRVSRGEAKKPFFHNHYTISSHTPFESAPSWYDSVTLPDFSPLCEGWESVCDIIKKYARMRYFTDMELGIFLDRMQESGVLNDTIVVVAGDHGQAPELGLANPFPYQTALTHVASMLIAEGRLGNSTGMVIEDTTHHYDFLNTLADIVGVPPEGFLQTGIGRSLKRDIPAGTRLVWSNVPTTKFAVVRGHRRLAYDRTAGAMGLYDTINDPREKHDLLPGLTDAEQEDYLAFRRLGRDLNSYFKKRWEKKCLTKVKC